MQAGVQRVAGWSAQDVIAKAGGAARLCFPRARLPCLGHARRHWADLAQGFGVELVEERAWVREGIRLGLGLGLELGLGLGRARLG